MVLRGPASNRSLNRENPDILIVMIAEEQIMRGGEEDKGDQREKGGDGPSKACNRNKWHCAKREFWWRILYSRFVVSDNSGANGYKVLILVSRFKKLLPMTM